MKFRALFFTTFLTTAAFCQQEPARSLPLEKDIIVQGIHVRLILLEIIGTPEGTFAKMIIGFKNPDSGEIIYFSIDKLPFNNQSALRFPRSSPLKIQKNSKGLDIDFLKPIIDEDNGRFYWKCSCQEIERIPI
jgi:hypothetical protein